MLTADSQGFDEYQKTIAEGMINPPILTGPSNLYFDEKQFHDEDDSMAEYGNGENGKFNEDGSFIGLYGKDRIQTYIVQYNQNNEPQSSNNQNNKNFSTFV
jgi:hypothetical protein